MHKMYESVFCINASEYNCYIMDKAYYYFILEQLCLFVFCLFVFFAK